MPGPSLLGKTRGKRGDRYHVSRAKHGTCPLVFVKEALVRIGRFVESLKHR